MGVSTPVVDLGQASRGSLNPSELPGFRQIGMPRVLTVSVTCNAPRAALRLRALHLEAGAVPRLLRWEGAAQGGALRMRLQKALADGRPVNLIGESGLASAELDIGRDGAVLAFDLAGLQGARQFQFNVELLGLLDDTFVPTSRTVFRLNPRLEIVEP